MAGTLPETLIVIRHISRHNGGRDLIGVGPIQQTPLTGSAHRLGKERAVVGNKKRAALRKSRAAQKLLYETLPTKLGHQ